MSTEETSINIFIGMHTSKLQYYALLLNENFSIGTVYYHKQSDSFIPYSFDKTTERGFYFDEYQELVDLLSEKYDMSIVKTPRDPQVYEGDTIAKQN